MRSQINLGRVFGIRIGLHYSWFIIALLIVLSLSAQFHTNNPEWGDGFILALAVTTAILFFLSLLLHELAHSVVAQSRGLPVREITLFALGGVSQIEKEPSSAKMEFWMAFVGPLTSACIGLLCLTLSGMSGVASKPITAMISWLGYINLALAGFNMIPGYPLDGGRILRALIWWKTGDVARSTRMASRVGQLVAFIFIGFGMLRFFGGAGIGGLWIVFIGWFLLQAAGESYLQVGLKRAIEGVSVGDVMTSDCPTVDGNLKLQHFVEEQLLPTGRRCFVVLENGTVAGLVTPHEVKQVDRSRWPFTTLHDIMLPLGQIRTVAPETPLISALEIMSRHDLNQLPVVSNGRPAGVLSRAHLLSFLRTRTELQA
jgi:Zn-dependent protease/predicted transcriptional regulator